METKNIRIREKIRDIKNSRENILGGHFWGMEGAIFPGGNFLGGTVPGAFFLETQK